MNMDRDIKLAQLGDKEAAKRLTDAGMLLPCPFCKKLNAVLNCSRFNHWIFCYECGADGPNTTNEYEARLAWNTRAPILSEIELKKLVETT